MCRPTRKVGSLRASATACAAAGPATIRLAALSTPCRCANSTASLTSAARPKSSAVMTRRTIYCEFAAGELAGGVLAKLSCWPRHTEAERNQLET